MYIYKCFCCFIVFIIKNSVHCFNNTNNINENKLLFVYEHSRHGARTPCKGLDDNYVDIFNHKWEGIGELTKLGMLQHYKLGLHYKEKYSSFISTSSYKPNEVLVYSTNLNRTIMSAQSQLNGLFSLNTSSLSNTHYPLPHVLIPIHLYEYGKENIILFNKELTKNCPNVKHLRESNKRSITVNNFISNFTNAIGKDFILKVLSNRNIKDINYKNIEMLCDAFISNYYEGNVLEIITQYKVNQEVLLNYCIEFSYLKHFFVEKGGKAYQSGIATISPYMNSILSYMDECINGKSKLKYVMYFGHDNTLSSIQIYLKKAFNIMIQKMPFASTILLHLVYNVYNKQHYIEYYFNNEMMLNITYNSFKTKINELLWNDNEIEDYCEGLSTTEITIFIFMLVCLSIIITITILLCYYYTNNNQTLQITKQKLNASQLNQSDITIEHKYNSVNISIDNNNN